MINEAIKEYRDNNAQLAEKYKDRIAELKAVAERDLLPPSTEVKNSKGVQLRTAGCLASIIILSTSR